MTADSVQNKIDNLPGDLKALVQQGDIGSRILDIVENFGIKFGDEKLKRFLAIVHPLFFKEGNLEELASSLEQALPVPAAEAAALAYVIVVTFFIETSESYPNASQIAEKFKQEGKEWFLRHTAWSGMADSKKTKVNVTGRVNTTADIRPVKRSLPLRPESAEGPPAVVPPATSVKPTAPYPEAAEGPPPIKEEKSKLDQFQLRSVEDLINVLPMVLAKEPDDEKQLVGRFKQEIQDIANYSGAKRTDIVAGWKQSQIYHTYIEMGNDSIQQGKPISDVMAFRKTSGKPYLTENQFHAISEVSRLLLR